MQNRSVNAGPIPASANSKDGETGKKISLFQGINISPARRAEVRAGLQRDFDQIFEDGAAHEIDPAINEREPAAGVA